jgi:hypothetical protein
VKLGFFRGSSAAEPIIEGLSRELHGSSSARKELPRFGQNTERVPARLNPGPRRGKKSLHHSLWGTVARSFRLANDTPFQLRRPSGREGGVCCKPMRTRVNRCWAAPRSLASEIARLQSAQLIAELPHLSRARRVGLSRLQVNDLLLNLVTPANARNVRSGFERCSREANPFQKVPPC